MKEWSYTTALLLGACLLLLVALGLTWAEILEYGKSGRATGSVAVEPAGQPGPAPAEETAPPAEPGEGGGAAPGPVEEPVPEPTGG